VSIVDSLKARVAPVRFKEANEREKREFEQQLKRLREYYGDVAVFLDPVWIGEEMPEADAIIFPQLIGAVYGKKELLQSYDKPMVVLTSQFGTVEMWDWEIISFLRSNGMNVFSPYNIELAKVILRAIAVKRHLKGAKFLMFQDDPGEGMQANIFKRFYWWEQQCTEQMEQAFGIRIIYKSWKNVNQRAAEISDEAARVLFDTWNVEAEGVSRESKILAAKLYIAVKEVIDELGGVDGVGANCLNESMSCQTTPCLAWNMLFENEGIIWCCEGDTLTLLSTYILYQSLKQPIMMTNIYPFLVGKAACSHEKIEDFPEVDEPENHALGVHCVYAGFSPRMFCEKWKMVPKVLEIVNEKSYMINCELPAGDIVLAKIMPTFDKITVIPAKVEKYVQFPGTDAENASLIYYQNGEGVMEELSSHHQMIITGKQKAKIEQIAKVFNWEAKIIL